MNLGTMFSAGNRAQTAQSGNPLNPGPESQTNNPYPQGITIPGTGANGASTTFQDFWDPATNSWAIHQGADGAIAPIYAGNYGNNSSGGWHSADASNGLGSNERLNVAAGNLDIANKGGGTTQVTYQTDPKTGYIIPVGSQGIGQQSWWQSTGIPIAETIAGAAAAGPLAGALGGGLIGGAAAGGIIGGAEAGVQGRSVGSGILSGAVGGGIGYGAGQLGVGATGAGAISGGVGAALHGGNIAQGAITGGIGAGLSSGISNAVGGGAVGAGVGAAGSSLASGEVGSLFNNGSSGVSTSSNPAASIGNPFGAGSNPLGSLASLYNTYQGNQSNQQLGNNLMGMYTNAGAQAAPSVQATNNLIQNPNSYFSSPLYQSQAALYGNNVDAQKNAAGTAGNGIDYTQKMMGFAGQNYNNYLSTVGNQAQGFLGNQAKYGQDYAVGTALANQSQAGANGQYTNALANLLGGAGGNSLLSSLGSGASSALSSLFGGNNSGTSTPDLSSYVNAGTSSDSFTNMYNTPGSNPLMNTDFSFNTAPSGNGY